MLIKSVLKKLRRKTKNVLPLARMQEDDTLLRIGDLRLVVRSSDDGGMQYQYNRSYEEIASPLYKEIASRYAPSLVLDVGANYGFTGVVFARSFPKAKIVLIEPSAELTGYIKRNFDDNDCFNYEIIHAICAEQSKENAQFSLNPFSSQDNRVIAENTSWKLESAQQVCLDDVIKQYLPQKFVFIKVDTQGYEQRVMDGFMDYLLHNKNWLLKTEFAPYWLRSQLSSPEGLLADWISKFHVCELPSRLRYHGDSLDAILKNNLDASQIPDFIAYIESQNANHYGWCDLLLSPRND